MTNADDEDLQATLQHVVVTYDPVNGRRVYVNGEDTGDRGYRGQRRHPQRLGRHLRLRARQRGLRQPPVTGVSAWSRSTTARSRRHRSSRTSTAGVGESYFLLFSVCAPGERAAELHHVRGQPVRQLQLPLQEADLHQPRSGRDAGRHHSDQGHAHRRERRRGARWARPIATLDTTISDRCYTPRDRSAAVEHRHLVSLEKGPIDDVLPDLRGARHQHQRRDRAGAADAAPPADRAAGRPTSACGPSTRSTRRWPQITGVSRRPRRRSRTPSRRQAAAAAGGDIEAFLSSHQVASRSWRSSYCSALVE